MIDTFSISIERAGVADLPELCVCNEPAMAAAVIQALLAAKDPRIMAVHISIVRIHVS